MNVNIVFIKNNQWWNLASRVIRFWTKSEYDHVGIYISKQQLYQGKYNIKETDSCRRISEIHHGRVKVPLIFDATLTKGVKLRSFNAQKQHERHMYHRYQYVHETL